ncbi:hypothetical protein ETAA8_42920 [Anatilimnocola aggregata]|uniref:Uncharacterized protein n=1 Tax=Anatilimnocola aggregata TaxID=2528021 RepID=A0A517YG23_9BACT|nr:hypothetical protein [Anatilimnocola aggregata]QDU29185.1 hypothetical protein ETAA8_42920 [Anatilimnocola aggregata]
MSEVPIGGEVSEARFPLTWRERVAAQLKRRSYWFPLLAVVLLLIPADFVVTKGVWSGEPITFLLIPLAMIAAQISLGSLGLVLGAGTFGKRLLMFGTGLLPCIAAYLCGWRAFDSYSREWPSTPWSWNGILMLIFVISAMLGAQFPLWLARLSFGWRFVRCGTDQASVPDAKLSILDLLMTTTMFAIALGVVRFSVVSIQADLQMTALMIASVLVAGFSALLTAIITLPLTVYFLGNHSLKTAWCVALLTYPLGFAVLCRVCTFFMPLHFAMSVGAAALLIGLAHTVSFAAGLLLLRTGNWQLLRRVRTEPSRWRVRAQQLCERGYSRGYKLYQSYDWTNSVWPLLWQWWWPLVMLNYVIHIAIFF